MEIHLHYNSLPFFASVHVAFILVPTVLFIICQRPLTFFNTPSTAASLNRSFLRILPRGKPRLKDSAMLAEIAPAKK